VAAEALRGMNVGKNSSEGIRLGLVVVRIILIARTRIAVFSVETAQGSTDIDGRRDLAIKPQGKVLELK